MSSIAESLSRIQDRLAAAISKANRAQSDVELLAVSKTFPAEVVKEAVEAGQLLLGENKVQELLAKKPLLPGKVRWHLIGHLQSNKIRKILPEVEAVHSIDSLDLAKGVDRVSGELGLRPKVYLEVNLAAESTKHGFPPSALEASLEEILALPRLEVQGLMCIPPFCEDVEASRPYFVQLRQLRDRLASSFDVPLSGLSMGMSHDFEVAVEEGSTIVRVGSAIFGSRGRA
ncbi:MAG: YggS family pyridoxal phosphate-dependent enzyme [Verrucomicrobiaceae bacterium]|nr:YggS family pyridoxal phosphate-dependent enzyme [Verrucomicrobiaceae bacterium]